MTTPRTIAEDVSAKRIVGFAEEQYGAFLDLADQPSAVSVSFRDGSVQLDEGVGADRYNDAVFFAGDLAESPFTVFVRGAGRSFRPVFGVRLRYGRDGVAQEHDLGSTRRLGDAVRWVHTVNHRLRFDGRAAPARFAGWGTDGRLIYEVSAPTDERVRVSAMDLLKTGLLEPGRLRSLSGVSIGHVKDVYRGKRKVGPVLKATVLQSTNRLLDDFSADEIIEKLPHKAIRKSRRPSRLASGV